MAGFLIAAGSMIGYLCAPYLARTLASYLVYPVLVIQHHCVDPLKRLFVQKQERQELALLVNQLQEEKDALQALLVQREALENFAHDTQELVAFKKRYSCASAVLAQVLVKHISDQAHYILVDVGSLQGITKDMIAVYKTLLLGKVVEVHPHHSKVVLITDAACKVAVYCATTHAAGIHVGSNKTQESELLHVSHLSALVKDDLLISSGEGLVFPRGFGVGKIKTFSVDGLLYQVKVEPLYNLATLEHCYVVQKGSEFALKDEIVATGQEGEKAEEQPDNQPAAYRGVDRARVRQ